MNSQKAMDALSALEPGSVGAHDDADRILIDYMKSLGFGAQAVAECWDRACKRVGFLPDPEKIG